MGKLLVIYKYILYIHYIYTRIYFIYILNILEAYTLYTNIYKNICIIYIYIYYMYIGNALYGLQNMSSKHKEVLYILSAINNGMRSLNEPMSPQNISIYYNKI